MNLAKSTGAIFVAPGDESGLMTNGWKYTGTIDLGGLDVWSFPADSGDNLVMRMASSIEFSIEDLFPGTEIQFALGNRHHHLAPRNLTFHVRVGVVLAGPGEATDE